MDKSYIDRTTYLTYLENFIDKPFVKVIIGMRRVGKSTLLKLLIQKLINKGIDEKSIVYINKESLEFDFISNYQELYKYVKSNLTAGRTNYIIIDEIQEIQDWEMAVTSFLAEDLGDIFISGSNAHLMSKELATYLSGRYVEIPVYPLTFREFLQFRKGNDDIDEEFKKYLRYGGMPAIHYLQFEDEVIFAYLNSLLNTLLYKDVVLRNRIRDPEILERIVRYLFDNIGNITTAKSISDFYKNQKIKISVDTVLNYLSYIQSALLIDMIKRYDIKGKKNLEFHDKVYLTDIGIRHGLIGYREKDFGGLLENIVYNELKFRGYQVKVGVISGFEIDFVAEKQNEKKYIQVCSYLADKKVKEREFGNLEKIPDNYEKVVISLDKFFPENLKGIHHIYLLDFLMEKV